MKPLSKKKRITLLTLSVIIFIAALPVLFLYALGYGVDIKEYLIVERGGLYVYAPETDTDIFIDGEHKRTSGFFQREYFVQRLRPDTYQVLLQHENFESWEKYVEVKGNRVTTLFPFMLPKEFAFADIASSTPLYLEVSKMFATTTSLAVPSATSTATTTVKPVTLTQNQLSIWFEGVKLFAGWQVRDSWIPDYFCIHDICENPTIIAEVSSPITRIEFYPGRGDVVLFSTEKTVYVVEVDKRSKQVFRSLYSGDDVDFRLRGDMLYVRDGLRIIEIEL